VRQKQTLWAAREYFTALASQGPVLAVIDDLHFADEASLALFQDLLQCTVQAPLLLCFLYRPTRDKGSWRIHDFIDNNYPRRHTEVNISPLTRPQSEELLDQLQFKDRLITMLAHELRNPLTAASIALETLESNYDSQNGQIFRLTPTLTAQLLKHARNQTRIIDRMISDILDASRGANPELSIVPQRLNLGALCQDAIEQCKNRLTAKSQQIQTDIPADLPYVYADPERVRQVLVNLLDNANKYTPEGGKIHVSVLHRTTQKIQVTVCDNGLGIPEENQRHIFDDRFRLKRDEMKEGYGIGLSLCQRIVRSHHGQIWVDSAIHQGSCFHFTLPVYRS
jgi:two-component system clock-associated histidine kinase SasA